MNEKHRIKGIVLVLLGATLWGVSGSVAQYLFQVKHYTPEWLVTVRLIISGVLLLGFARVKTKKNQMLIWRDKEDRKGLIFFSLVGMLGVQYSYFAAIKYGNAATATILQYLSPVLIACYLAVKNKRLPSLKQLIAILMAVLGTLLIVTKGNFATLSIGVLALFWGLMSALTAAFYTLQPQQLLKRWGSLTLVGWGMLIGGMTFALLRQPWSGIGLWDYASLLAIGFVVIFGTLIAFTCYLESLHYISPTETSILSSAEPLSAAFLSVVWLHSPLAPVQWLGTCLIIMTIVVLSYTKKQRLPVNR
jgi:drug/metabolite transporter (DMT)-like permease